jgi:membrane protease YdiL (CAAX protease family)
MQDMPTSPETPSAAPRAAPHAADVPRSQSEIEEVFGDSALAASEAQPAASMAAEWRRLGAFLKRPTLAVSEQSASPLKVIGRIYLLDALIMLALVLAATIAVALDVYIPSTALAGLEFTPAIIFMVVVGAPVLEEIVFRGWLSGRPAPILALASLAFGLAGFAFLHTSSPIFGIVLGLAGLTGAALAFAYLRGAEPMRWFAAVFPGFFWATTAAFALVHLANFEEGSLAILLPLVLPQFMLGMFVGYLRVRLGLWAAILLHAMHNASALTLAGLAMLAEG